MKKKQGGLEGELDVIVGQLGTHTAPGTVRRSSESKVRSRARYIKRQDDLGISRVTLTVPDNCIHGAKVWAKQQRDRHMLELADADMLPGSENALRVAEEKVKNNTLFAQWVIEGKSLRAQGMSEVEIRRVISEDPAVREQNSHCVPEYVDKVIAEVFC